jgi:hypothetical protein
MRRVDLFTISAMFLVGFGASAGAQQQPAAQVMGTVATRDALVSGGLQVQGERAELVSNASVTAYDHTAAIGLARGGEVMVCATSQFHLLHSGTDKSLLFGLDRGAVEIHGASDPQDVILTPDLFFKLETPGKLDLALRVTRDGDTCVDNAGSAAPVLVLSDAFSSASYRLLPGQHVLFEHGDLHQVVDNETSSCGCPVAPPVESAAAMSGRTALSGPAAVAAEHPFPAAASEGLARETAPANSGPAGEKHTQVAATLAYGPGVGPPPETVGGPAAKPSSNASAASATGGGDAGSGNSRNGDSGNGGPVEPPQTPPGAHDIAHAIGRFFHRLFHHGAKKPSPAS